MQSSVLLFIIGIAFVWIGSFVLFAGKKKGISYSEIVVEGTKIYGMLNRFFKEINIIVFKIFIYLGIALIMFGIVKMF